MSSGIGHVSGIKKQQLRKTYSIWYHEIFRYWGHKNPHNSVTEVQFDLRINRLSFTDSVVTSESTIAIVIKIQRRKIVGFSKLVQEQFMKVLCFWRKIEILSPESRCQIWLVVETRFIDGIWGYFCIKVFSISKAGFFQPNLNFIKKTIYHSRFSG